jgi:alanine dehydrogenase
MPLYLRESDVEELLPPEDAVEAVEDCFKRLGSGEAENRPRYRIPLNEGTLNILGAADRELGVAGLKSYVAFATGARFVVVLFAADSPEVLALIEADRLGQMRTGGASAVAARHLAKPDATSLGIIGTG